MYSPILGSRSICGVHRRYACQKMNILYIFCCSAGTVSVRWIHTFCSLSYAAVFVKTDALGRFLFENHFPILLKRGILGSNWLHISRKIWLRREKSPVLATHLLKNYFIHRLATRLQDAVVLFCAATRFPQTKWRNFPLHDSRVIRAAITFS